MKPESNIKILTNRFILGLFVMLAICVSPKVNAQINMTLLGNLPISANVFDVAGYVDSQGNEYAIIGADKGAFIVDVTIPSNPDSVFFISGTNSWWRGVEVYNNYAYITSQSTGGLMIIDLSSLPFNTNLTVSYFTGVTYSFQIAHELFIDENGICYIFGSNYGNGGAIMLDLSASPTNPVELGVFDQHYLHDGMVRGDTLWGAAIYQGYFSVIDVSNKSSPVLIATHNTPAAVTHNCWISDDGKTLFTTDKTSGGYIISFDVSDLNNITELNKIRSNPGSGSVPYNTTVFGHFLVNSFHKDGVTIVDATHPENMVEVGNYDTYPSGSGDGFTGCQGVYSFLPSGNIIATDMENGLFVLNPVFIRACYLEGLITKLGSGNPVYNVNVEILSSSALTSSNLSGNYKTGIVDSGTYSVQYSKAGYFTKIVTGVNLSHGITTTLNVEMIDSASIGINETYENEYNFIKNYPNPFSESTTIGYLLSEQSEVTITIYNPLGERVNELVKQSKPAGKHEALWNAKDFSPGIYFYEIRAVNENGTFRQVNKISLVK